MTAASDQDVRSVRTGTLMGAVAAVGYTVANLGLRDVAQVDDVDWAIWVTANKALPVTIAVWVLIGWTVARGEPAFPPRRLLLRLFAAGLIMQFGGNVLFQWALSLGGLAITVPLMFASIIATGAWLGRVFLGDPVTPRTLRAMGLLIGAIALLSAGVSQATADVAARRAEAPGWDAVALAVPVACVSGLAYGMTGVVIRGLVTRGVPVFASMMMFCTTGVVVLGTISLVRLGPARLAATTPDQWRSIILAGVCNAIAFFALGGALRRISVNRCNLLNASQVAMCAVGGVLVFSEPVTWTLVAGCALTVVGILMVDSGAEARD